MAKPISKATFFWTSITSSALSSRLCSLWLSRVSCAICCISARCGSDLGPRFCGARAARSAASRWRRQVLKLEEYTPSRRINAPTSPGRAQRSAVARMRRLSASEKRRRRAWATTCMSAPGGAAGAAVSAASPVALRAPSNAAETAKRFAAFIAAFDRWFMFIPTSLLTELSGVGVALHIGTGGIAVLI